MNKLFKRKPKEGEEKKGRITDATVEEHKEKVLAKGRKFRYPLQYSRYRVAISTTVIAAVALIFFGVFGWMDLYVWQDTGDIGYGLARLLPMPVGEVDGEKVRFSDYLMIYRASVVSIERQQGSLDDLDGGDAIKDGYKRQALSDAVRYAYAMKLARELGVEATQEDVDEMSREHRMVGGVEKSRETYEKILWDNFGMSISEYERLLKLVISKRKVEEKIDTEALAAIEKVRTIMVQNDGNIDAVREEMGDRAVYEWSGGLVASDNLDGGRAAMASGLENGEISEIFVSQNGDGYFVVRTGRKTDGEVEYTSVFVRFTELENRIAGLREEGKVKEYVSLPVQGAVEGEE